MKSFLTLRWSWSTCCINSLADIAAIALSKCSTTALSTSVFESSSSLESSVLSISG
ncbi:Uncharacterised protein [Segatella copri]|nr:Uncharacterised protein [Segatella copri]